MHPNMHHRGQMPQHHYHQQHYQQHQHQQHQHSQHSNGYQNNMPISESDRKAFRRNLQDDSTQRKMERETEFFWTVCNKNKKHRQQAPRMSAEKEERELFGKQGSVGIKFNAYEAIPVECNGPGTENFVPMGSFDEVAERLPSFVMNNILKMKYDVPTPIQKYAVPLGLSSHDLMCCAQTGSGKTCAFLLPMIVALTKFCEEQVASSYADEGAQETSRQSEKRYESSVNEQGVHPLAIILAPTRELASQIHLECRKLIFASNLRALVLYGGSDIRQQLSDLSFGCDIIVATPGRLIDIIDRGIVNLSLVRCLVLDEADRMLDMGFEPQIREIVQMRNMPPREDRQTLMFSATFKPDIQKLAAEFLREYVWVGVGRVGSTVENIKQVLLKTSADLHEKLNLTLEAVKETRGQTLIFVQKKRTASWLCETLRYQFHLRVDEIHSDKSQGQREASLRRFREGQIRILVGTDVAARGLDISNVGHVIQFDLPFTSDEFDTYIHRMGRTGRAGHSGLATSLFVPGTVNGEGNGRVAPLIMQLLEENNQEIPAWFKEVHDSQLISGKRGKKGGNKFGSRDVRVPYGQKQNTQYVGGGSRGPQQMGQYKGGGYMRGGMPMHQHTYNGRGQGVYQQHQQHQFHHNPQQPHPPHLQQQRGYMAQQGYAMHGMPANMEQGGYHPQMMGYAPPNMSNYQPQGQVMPPPPDGNGPTHYAAQGPPQGQGQGQGKPPTPQDGQGQVQPPANEESGNVNTPSQETNGDESGGDSPGNSHKTKRPPSLDVPQGYPPNGMNMTVTPGSYGMPVHFMPPSPSPGPYMAPSPHFMMPPTPSGYNYSPRTYNPSITSPSHVMRVDASQMRVDAPTFVPGPSGDQQSGGH
mmetsp:Transcript_13613/g.22449  ORF Transcript_13613/g.22449 Transcript_13613/m.22449 type:complete len:869 (-) Transcript_13613:698-3304(-)